MPMVQIYQNNYKYLVKNKLKNPHQTLIDLHALFTIIHLQFLCFQKAILGFQIYQILKKLKALNC